LRNRRLNAAGRGDRYPPELVDVVARFAQIADIDLTTISQTLSQESNLYP